MTRKFKALGISVLGVLALSVLAVPASAYDFTASKYPTTATASSALGNDEFKTEAGSVECKAHFKTEEMWEQSWEISIVPSYSECKAFGFLSATVKMNGCHYNVQTNVWLDLACHHFVFNFKTLEWETIPTGPLTITAGTCEVTMGTQENLSAIYFENGESGIEALAEVTGIKYTVTKDGFGCPFGGTGVKEGASYTQNSAVTFQSTNGATIDIGL